MLADHPEEQLVLFKEIMYKKYTVRDAEKLARKIAYDRVRKKEFMPDPEIVELEEEFQEKLGTRVHIDKKDLGGQIKIDFFSTDDLRSILEQINKAVVEKKPTDMLENFIAKNAAEIPEIKPPVSPLSGGLPENDIMILDEVQAEPIEEIQVSINNTEPSEDDRNKEEIKEDDTKLYDISNFSI